jgi:hypothetical protein
MALILKSVPAARGPRWIGDAFRLYARRPLAFTALFLVFVFASVLVAQVPLLGLLVQLMSLPLLSLGFMVAGQSALLDGPVRPIQFIEPLRHDPAKRRALLTLCVSFGVLALAILMLADAVSNSAWSRLQALMVRGESVQAEIDALLSEPGVGVAMLIAGVLLSLLSVPFWHAPALVHWGGQGVRQALFSSTLALWRNKGAFFSYMLAWLGAMMLFGLVTAFVFALIGEPQLAGVIGVPAWLVFSAVFYISVLFTFNDSFGGAPPATDVVS